VRSVAERLADFAFSSAPCPSIAFEMKLALVEVLATCSGAAATK
jgi:hypothetical protein